MVTSVSLAGLLVGSLLAVVPPAPLAAQLPGESVTRAPSNLRQEFLSVTYQETQQALETWLDLVNRRDPTKAMAFIADGAVFAPVDGGVASGRAAIADSLARWLPRVAGYGFTAVDFDASASLVYVLGSVHYQLQDEPAARVVRATATMVLTRRGSRWMLRSYLERPTPR